MSPLAPLFGNFKKLKNLDSQYSLIVICFHELFFFMTFEPWAVLIEPSFYTAMTIDESIFLYLIKDEIFPYVPNPIVFVTPL